MTHQIDQGACMSDMCQQLTWLEEVSGRKGYAARQSSLAGILLPHLLGTTDDLHEALLEHYDTHIRRCCIATELVI